MRAYDEKYDEGSDGSSRDEVWFRGDKIPGLTPSSLSPPSPPISGRALFILESLKEEYPGTTTGLSHRDPFQLMIATILSAQTTDVQVNKATPALFERFTSPEEFAEADIEEIEHYIKTLGFYHSKARYLKNASERIIIDFQGKVPGTMEDLITLQGVARKTANIVLAHGFGKQEGIAVDTHVKRLSGRLGLSSEKDPVRIEQDLMKLIPGEDWGLFSDLLIHHGRAVCSARKPGCQSCFLMGVCPTGKIEARKGDCRDNNNNNNKKMTRMEQ